MQVTQHEAVLVPASSSTRVFQARPSLVGAGPADTGAGKPSPAKRWGSCMFVHPLGARHPLLFGWVSAVTGSLYSDRDGETRP